MVARTEYDDAGRVIRTIENYTENPCGGSDVNVTVETTYTPDGNVETLTAINAATGNQTTRYVYGTTLPDSGVARSDLLAAEIYPDAADSTDSVRYQYNRQADVTQLTDQNGSVHEYKYDGFGRRTADKITTVGSGVDQTVLRIDTAYEIRGMVSKVTSYTTTTPTTVKNQVVLWYNDFAQLISDKQAHGGAANGAPAVLYSYADGSANTVRRETMIYPDGELILNYDYGSSDNESLSRVQSLNYNTINVVDYTYFGLRNPAMVEYPDADELNLTLASGASYGGLDQFGRIDDLAWKIGATNKVRLRYGYDRASNRIWREDLVATPQGEKFDEQYAYDGLHRLVDFNRGQLEETQDRITLPSSRQAWNLDPTGNWSGFTASECGDFCATNAVGQRRSHNAANDITNIATTVGNAWWQTAHDRNGNRGRQDDADYRLCFAHRVLRIRCFGGTGLGIADRRRVLARWKQPARNQAAGACPLNRRFPRPSSPRSLDA